MKKLISLLGVGVIATAGVLGSYSLNYQLKSHSAQNHNGNTTTIDLGTVKLNGDKNHSIFNNLPTNLTWNDISDNVYKLAYYQTNFKDQYGTSVTFENFKTLVHFALYDNKSGVGYGPNNIAILKLLSPSTQIRIRLLPFQNTGSVQVGVGTTNLVVSWSFLIKDYAKQQFEQFAHDTLNGTNVISADPQSLDYKKVTPDEIQTSAQSLFYKQYDPEHLLKDSGYQVYVFNSQVSKVISQPDIDHGFDVGNIVMSLSNDGHSSIEDRNFGFLTNVTKQLTDSKNNFDNSDRVVQDAKKTMLKDFVKTIGKLITYPENSKFQVFDLLLESLLKGKAAIDKRYDYNNITTSDFLNLINDPLSDGTGNYGFTTLMKDLMDSPMPKPVKNYVDGQDPYETMVDKDGHTTGWDKFWSDLGHALGPDGFKYFNSNTIPFPAQSDFDDNDSSKYVDYTDFKFPIYQDPSPTEKTMNINFPILRVYNKFLPAVLERTAPDLIQFAHFVKAYYWNDSTQTFTGKNYFTAFIQYLSVQHDSAIDAFLNTDGFHNPKGVIDPKYITRPLVPLNNNDDEKESKNYFEDLVYDLLGDTFYHNNHSDVSSYVYNSFQYGGKTLFGTCNKMVPIKAAIGLDNLPLISIPASFRFFSILDVRNWLIGVFNQQLSGINIWNKDGIFIKGSGILENMYFKIIPFEAWQPMMKIWMLSNNGSDLHKYDELNRNSDVIFDESDPKNNNIFGIEGVKPDNTTYKLSGTINDFENAMLPSKCIGLNVDLNNVNFTFKYKATADINQPAVHFGTKDMYLQLF